MAAPKWNDAFIRGYVRNDVNEMREAIKLGLPLKAFIEHGYATEYTALHIVCKEGAKPPVVKVLIDAGADVNARGKAEDDAEGRPVLMLAAWQCGQPEVIKMLLDAGADAKATSARANGRPPMTILTWACMGGKSRANEAIVKMLLKAGAKAEIDALISAVRNGSPDMVQLIIDAGADVNDTSVIRGWGTALHAAIREKRVDNVEVLLRAGAMPTIAGPAGQGNYPGQTALDLAKKMKLKKLIPMLETAAKGVRPAPAAPPPPMTAADIPDIWKRLKKVLPAEVKKSLRKGAVEANIAALQKAAKVTLPVDFLASYGLIDGQKEQMGEVFPEGFANFDAPFVLMTLAEAAKDWKLQDELLKGGEFKGQNSNPDAGVRNDWWNAGWIPFASNGGGDYLCVDMAPDKGGAAGQIVVHRHDADERSLIAPSFAALLANLAEHWQDNPE